jgi:uncharacterized protein
MNAVDAEFFKSAPPARATIEMARLPRDVKVEIAMIAGKPMPPYRRPVFSILVKRLREPRRFIQVLAGPRQAGKTTLAQQVMAETGDPAHYASAHEPLLKDRTSIQEQWEIARTMIMQRRRASALLVLDEVQKIPGWPDTVKHLWDQDSATALHLRVLLLGSSPC